MNKQKRFQFSLEQCVDQHSFNAVGSWYHSRGAATENARSPNFSLGLRTAKSPWVDARSADRSGISATGVSKSSNVPAVRDWTLFYEPVGRVCSWSAQWLEASVIVDDSFTCYEFILVSYEKRIFSKLIGMLQSSGQEHSVKISELPTFCRLRRR